LDFLNKMVREKKELEETKTNLKIKILKTKKPRGLRVVANAHPNDKDVKAAHKKDHILQEIKFSKGAELTQKLKIKKVA